MKLYDYAKVIRSKNAGPFTLTIDLMFDCPEKFEHAFKFLSEQKNTVAGLYKVESSDKIKLYPFPNANTVKITLPRPVSSGGIGDIDVYGSQQHFPLAEIELP